MLKLKKKKTIKNNKMEIIKKEKSALNGFIEKIDWILIATVIFLLGLGFLGIYSATIRYGNAEKYLATQLAAIGLGGCVLIVFFALNYQVFKRIPWFTYGIASFLLISVLIFGNVVRGTKGWFYLGAFSFQPVEIAKIFYILSLAAFLTAFKRQAKDLSTLLSALGLLFGQVVLVLLQPDFGSSLVFFPITIALLFVFGAELMYILAIILFGTITMCLPLFATFFRLQPELLAKSELIKFFVAAANGANQLLIVLGVVLGLIFLLWWVSRQLKTRISIIFPIVLSLLIVFGSFASFGVQKAIKPYQQKRLIVFLNPSIDPLGSGYNIIQSKIAIGSGGALGKGLFSGTQSKLGFLPEQHTDFIFSVLGEELGFFITLFALFAYFLIVWRALLIARDARDIFGSLVAVGIATMFAFYGIINMGMVMGMMPCTGLPLSFISYGGSNIVSSLCAIGLLLSIHIRRHTH